MADSGTINLDRFEIVRTGLITVQYNNLDGAKISTANHNLGYVPAFLAYIVDPISGQLQLANSPYVNHTSGITDQITNFFVTSTQVIMEVVAPSAGSYYNTKFTVNAKYYLLKETAN